jgi:acyl carrier protein
MATNTDKTKEETPTTPADPKVTPEPSSTTQEAAPDADPAEGTTNDEDVTTTETGDGMVVTTGEPPVRPEPMTAKELVAGHESPAKVKEEVTEVLQTFRTTADIGMWDTANIFDDLGLSRAGLQALTDALNKKFDTVLLLTEAENFLLVRDVTNMMMRKIAVRETLKRA